MASSYRGALPSAAVTRPADVTAYASGDLLANSTTAGSVVPLSFTLARPAEYIRRVRVSKSGTTATNAQFRLHLYTASPVPANGDNGAWSTSKAANYLGYADVTLAAFTDGCAGIGSPGIGADVNVVPTGSTIYGLLEVRAAYTPASAEVFTVALELGNCGCNC